MYDVDETDQLLNLQRPKHVEYTLEKQEYHHYYHLHLMPYSYPGLDIDGPIDCFHNVRRLCGEEPTPYILAFWLIFSHTLDLQ